MNLRGVVLAVALVLSSGVAVQAMGQAKGGAVDKTLVPQGTLYPRLVRLEHGSAESKGQILANTNGVILRSTDEGRTFEYVSTVEAVEGSKKRCCVTLYEMPKTVGKLTAGTLISAGSYFSGTQAAIELYTSTDEGRSWGYLATPVKRGGEPHHGLWEPEFTVAKDGALVMFWSDETDPCCSQKLAQMRTYDGEAWKDERDTVRGTEHSARPGMIVVSSLPDGSYFMSYELCGPMTKCTVYTRMSKDGWNWGSPQDMGTKAVSKAGQYFAHAPTNRWVPVPGSERGEILLIGQMLMETDGKVSPQNGQVLFVSKKGGRGRWKTMPAPVPVPSAYDNYCPNYSSALLPVDGGRSLLELASEYDSAHHCVTYAGMQARP